MQGQRRNLLIRQPVAGNFPTLAEEHEVGGAVPVLGHVQAFVNLPSESLLTQVDGLDRRPSLLNAL